MKRLVLAVCLSVPGLAIGQTGGGVIILTPGAPDVGTITVGGPILPPSFTFDPIVIAMPGEPPAKAAMAGLNPTTAIPHALDPAAMLYGEQPILTVEEEGVRLPEKLFTLPPE